MKIRVPYAAQLLCAALLLSFSVKACAQSTTNVSVPFEMPKSSNPLSAYSPSQVPEPRLTNSPLINQLIQDHRPL
jgi:hypothetical protein